MEWFPRSALRRIRQDSCTTSAGRVRYRYVNSEGPAGAPQRALARCPARPYARPMRLVLETGDGTPPPAIPGEGRCFVAFLSFAAMRGFGAQHPLIALAERLHTAHGVLMGPLTTFYDATIEDSEDREKLDLAWQPAEVLRDAVAQLIAAIEADEQARTLLRRADATGLHDEAAAILPALESAAARGTPVRLSYVL